MLLRMRSCFSVRNMKKLMKINRRKCENTPHKKGKKPYDGPDKISESPSLSIILSYLDDPKDVIRCRFISTRWNQVVVSHYRSMARFGIRIRFHTGKDETNGLECLQVRIHDTVHGTGLFRGSLILISDKRIRFSKDISPLFHCYLKNGAQLNDAGHSPEERYLQKLQTLCSCSLRNPIDFCVSSREEGLATLFTFLCGMFKFTAITFTEVESFAQSYLTALLQVFRQYPSQCEEISIRELWPQLGELYRVLGEPLVGIYPIGDVERLLSVVSRWRCRISLRIVQKNLEQFTPIFDFVKSWQNGVQEIIYLLFPLSFLDVSPPWPIATVYQALRTLGFYSLCYSDEDRCLEFTMKRKKDDSTIRLYYSVACRYIEVRDSNYTHNPPSLLVLHKFYEVPLRKKHA